ncbi:MAG: hypothetical protein F2607_07265 [Actinobacteria bacterium]|uniref:Unannotated protein n=1 Tax=freshwater metagenome TaxID=449393 RepID=A0A6J6IBA4_9ZZZZ|nr:hypothetical protein [Actinomycetota bacterium]MSZ94494.1 hypothetical protein [Actinomycetota bacterium]
MSDPMQGNIPEAPSGNPGTSQVEPLSITGFVMIGLGVILGLSALLPWFEILGQTANGFAGGIGESGGWILGIPPGWLLLLAGIALVVSGVLLVVPSGSPHRHIVSIAAVAISILAFVVIIGNRMYFHQNFDDAKSKAGEDAFSKLILSGINLNDGAGFWLGAIVSFLAIGVSVAAMLMVNASQKSEVVLPPPPVTQ